MEGNKSTETKARAGTGAPFYLVGLCSHPNLTSTLHSPYPPFPLLLWAPNQSKDKYLFLDQDPDLNPGKASFPPISLQISAWLFTRPLHSRGKANLGKKINQPPLKEAKMEPGGGQASSSQAQDFSGLGSDTGFLGTWAQAGRLLLSVPRQGGTGDPAYSELVACIPPSPSHYLSALKTKNHFFRAQWGLSSWDIPVWTPLSWSISADLEGGWEKPPSRPCGQSLSLQSEALGPRGPWQSMAHIRRSWISANGRRVKNGSPANLHVEYFNNNRKMFLGNGNILKAQVIFSYSII